MLLRKLFFGLILGTLSATAGNARLHAAEGGGPLLISVDNPAFRKMVVAIPGFEAVGTPTSPQAKKLVEEGSAELIRLLNFSGFFTALAPGAYEEAWKNYAKAHKTKESSAWILDSKGLTGPDLTQFRALGMESLTMASVQDDPVKGITISFKTVDIGRGKDVLAKQFTRVTDYKATLRQYADYLLEAYTGKPGIFNSKIVFIGRRTKASNKQVFVVDFDGSNLTQVTTGEYPHLSANWSPDGRSLVFTAYEFRNPDIFTYDTQTRVKKRLTTTPGLDSGGNFAPNGKLVAYTSSRGDDTDIYTTTVNGTDRKLLIEGSGLDVDPKFSPDGKWIAFVSGRYVNPHIFVGALQWNGDNPKVTSDKRLTYAGWYNATPAWSPESDKIAFGGYDRDIDRWDLFMMNPDGSKLERLTLKSGDNESPSFSPNGQLIVYQSNRVGEANVKGLSSIWIMNRDGSNQHKLEISGIYDAQTPQWSRNRKLD